MREVSLKELLFSETATRLGIDNTPTDQILINLQTLIHEIINPIINQFGDIKITSGYRSPALCKELADWVVNHLPYDQVILEFWKPEEANSGWVHISYNKANNRKMYLRAYKGNGRTIYEVI
jgi:hypothetical protein